MERGGSIYILSNERNTVLYVGVTSDLLTRVQEHKDRKHSNSFSIRYNTHKLVYFENFHSIEEAIAREKQIKKYRRAKKDDLINKKNPERKDLFEEVSNW